MAKLKENIKRMLSALAYQNANEYLSSYDKMEIIGHAEKQKSKIAGNTQSTKKQKSSGIALIIDNHENEASLRYTIEAAQRQNASVDLLLHGAIDNERIVELEASIVAAGVACKRMQLGANAMNDIINYLFTHSDLIYLVASPDDSLVQDLIEKELPERDLRLPVPLVMMTNKDHSRGKKRTAA